MEGKSKSKEKKVNNNCTKLTNNQKTGKRSLLSKVGSYSYHIVPVFVWVLQYYCLTSPRHNYSVPAPLTTTSSFSSDGGKYISTIAFMIFVHSYSIHPHPSSSSSPSPSPSLDLTSSLHLSISPSLSPSSLRLNPSIFLSIRPAQGVVLDQPPPISSFVHVHPTNGL